MGTVVMEKQTLTTKDFIIAGAFAVPYLTLFFAVATVMGFIPIGYIFTPFILSVVLGPVHTLYVSRIPKCWVVIGIGGSGWPSYLDGRFLDLSYLVLGAGPCRGIHRSAESILKQAGLCFNAKTAAPRRSADKVFLLFLWASLPLCFPRHIWNFP
jgi:hypothetical protein